MTKRALRIAAVVAACVTSGTGGYVAYRVARNVAPTEPLAACALKDAVYIPHSALPRFVPFLDYAFDSLPRAMGPNYLVKARQTGMLARDAVSGPFRASLDAIARSHGYRVGKYPLTPLSGPIVEAMPGPLEEYETNYVFTRSSAAHEWFAGRERNGSGIADAHDTFFPVAIGDESFGIRSNDSNTAHETLVYVGLRVGRVVVQIDVLGGVAVSNTRVTALASAVAGRLRQDCVNGGEAQ